MMKSFDHINRLLKRFALVLLALAWSTNILADNVNAATWSALQDAMTSDNTITLTANITAGANDTYLEVPEGKTVTLNLNGNTINRNLSTAIDNGYVIKNSGNLTINGSGTIKGGNNTGDGGGICNNGTLTITEVIITGNKAGGGGGIGNRCGYVTITGGTISYNEAETGGGISNFYMRNRISYLSTTYFTYNGRIIIDNCTITRNTASNNGGGINSGATGGYSNSDQPVITINNCSITYNTAGGAGGAIYWVYPNAINGGTITNNTSGSDGGGIYYTTGKFDISGFITINNNKKGTVSNNVFLYDGNFTVTDNLNSNTRIGVSVRTPKVITSGLSGNGALSNFTSDDASSYTLCLNESSGEAVLKGIISPEVNMVDYQYGSNYEPSVTSESNPGNGTPTYTYQKNSTGSFSGIKPTTAGTHKVKAVIPETDLYMGGEATKTYTIEQRTANFTWSNTSLTYNRSAQKPTATVSNLVNGDVCTVTVSGQQTNAGTYTATATELSNSNYIIKPQQPTYTTQFTIAKKSVTVSGITASNKVYDGKRTASLNTSNASFGGLISGDALTVTASGNFDNANVGTGKNVSITRNSLGGSSANNYQFAASGHQTTTTANITKKDLTVTANNHTITYGDFPNNAGVSYDGFVNNQTQNVLGGELSYAYNYSQYGDVGLNYTITPSGLTSSNYDITFNAGTLTVEQKEVGLNWTNISFTYDKTVKTPTATATGMVNGDEIGVTVTGGQTNAGSHTATASELTGTKNGNYKLPSSKTQAFSISKAEITVSGITAENKTYDKTTNATLVYTAANLAGKIEGDNLSVSATGTFADENIGTGKNVTISALTLGGTSVGNYQLAGSGQQSYTTANITAKTVGLNWSDTSFDYNGSPWAPTAEATGVIAGDVCNVTVSVDEEHTAVGSYTAEATALDNGNYALPAEKTHDYEIVRPMTGIEFTASKHWNTYYAFENLATPTGIKAYIVTGVSGTTATTSEIGYIPKDVGVLLYSASAGSGFKASAYTGAAGSFTSNKLNGSTTTTDLDSEAGYILYGDAFVLTTGGMLPANRCYLPANMGAGTRSLTIDGGDGTTSLYKVNSEEMGDDKWFDLQGQRIEKPQKKGLYIKDGKKVVIK